MAVPREDDFPNDINALDRITPHSGTIESKGEIPASDNRFPTDFLDLLGPPDAPPGQRNGAPDGPQGAVKRAAATVGKETRYSEDNNPALSEKQSPKDDLCDFAELLGPVSPLDRPLKVSRFEDVEAQRIARATLTLRQVAEAVGTTSAPSKKALPLIKLASFGDIPTHKGSLRHDANLIGVEGVEGDYDGGEVSLAQAVKMLRTADLAAVVYSTPSHTVGAPRWRVLAPLSCAVSPDDRGALAERLNGALGGILTGESFTRSQAFYFGGVGGPPEVHTVDGRALDTATDIPRLGKGGRPPVPEVDHVEADDTDDLASLIEPDWDRIRNALQVIPADDRDDWRTIGMVLHHAGRGSDEAAGVWEEWSRTSHKFDGRDQARVWRSFGKSQRRPVDLGTLFNLAKSHGWTSAAPKAGGRLIFLSPDDCLATPARDYVIKGLIGPGNVGCIFGIPGAGKSVIAPHLAYAVAQGRPAFGMRTKAASVLYVAAEAASDMQERVKALRQEHGAADTFALVAGVSDLLNPASGDLAELQAAIAERRPGLVVIDTLAAATSGLDENDGREMARVVKMARSLTTHGAAVILVHHSTKADDPSPRGHSVLNGDLDVALHVQRGDDGIVRGRLTKNRQGPCDKDIAFLINAAELGTDSDGDAITAPLLSELDGLPPERSMTPEEAALERLRILEEGDGLDPGHVRHDVREADWRAACLEDRRISGAERIESRKRALRRLIEKMSARGLIAFDDGCVRLCAHGGVQ